MIESVTCRVDVMAKVKESLVIDVAKMLRCQPPALGEVASNP